jgi:hypothetical protein
VLISEPLSLIELLAGRTNVRGKLQIHFLIGSTRFIPLKAERRRHGYQIMLTHDLLQNIRWNVNTF